MSKIIKIISLSIIGVALALSGPVMAQNLDTQPQESPTVERLKDRCDTILSTLRRLHTHDALLRVNTGQIYNGISVRLMARLNSRLAINRIDSTKLVEITGRFEDQRVNFADTYSKYEAAMATLVKKDCKANPADFYQSLILARDERTKLAAVVKELNSTVSEYRVAVEQLKQDIASNSQKDQDATD